MRWRVLIPVLLVILIGSPVTAMAEYVYDLRCGTALVTPGEMEKRVFEKCGEPTNRQVLQDQGSPRNPGNAVGVIEIWTYNFGATDYIYTLRFEEGALKEIIRNGRGY